MKHSHTLGIIAIASALAALPVAAQDYQAQPATPAADSEQAWGEATLRKFAAAQAEVAGIRDDFSARIGEATGQEQAQQLQEQAHAKMLGAISNLELDVETYNAIAQAMQIDPALRARVASLQ